MKGPDDSKESLDAEALERLGTSRHDISKERVTVLRPAGFSNLEVWRAERSRRNWQVFHDKYAICSVDPGWRGVARWRCRGREHDMSTIAAQLFEPGDSHNTFRVEGPPADFHVLMVAPAEVSKLFSQASKLPHFDKGVVECAELWGMFQRLVVAFQSPSASLERGARLVEYLERVFQAATGSGGRDSAPHCDWRCKRVREIILERYAEDLRLDELAAEVELSPSSLIRLFERATSMSVHRFQMAVRLSKARELMEAHQRPSHISEAVGFYDPSHFRLMFQRYHGFTPSHYFSQVQPKPASASK
jgi:AraC-like DNA-binding protein